MALFSLLDLSSNSYGQAGVPAAVSSQTQQDQQLRTQLKETEQLSQPSPEPEARQLLAKPLSPDMGQVNILGEEPSQPWFSISVDCQAFYNSNVTYAEQANLVFGAWQIITTPEISFAPTIQDETFKMLSPRAGFRYQFFTYAQAEPYPTAVANSFSGQPYTVAIQNFRISNPYAGLGWRVDDDLSFDFSFQANLYTSHSPYSPSENFLNEYPLAWQANWFKPIGEINSFSITARASYVWALPTNFSRTDNNLTVSWGIMPTKEISMQFYASGRLAKYTGLNPTAEDNPGSNLGYFPNNDRLDLQQTYGASVTWTPVEYVSLRGFVSWSMSNSSINVSNTGNFEALNAGTGLNLIYRF